MYQTLPTNVTGLSLSLTLQVWRSRPATCFWYPIVGWCSLLNGLSVVPVTRATFELSFMRCVILLPKSPVSTSSPSRCSLRNRTYLQQFRSSCCMLPDNRWVERFSHESVKKFNLTKIKRNVNLCSNRSNVEKTKGSEITCEWWC